MVVVINTTSWVGVEWDCQVGDLVDLPAEVAEARAAAGLCRIVTDDGETAAATPEPPQTPPARRTRARNTVDTLAAGEEQPPEAGP